LAQPRFNVLTWLPPTTEGLEWVEIYKRVTPGPVDTLVDRERVVDRVPGFYPYFYILVHSEAGATYVIDYVNQSGARLGTRISTEQYVPPAAIQREIYVNGAQFVKELVRRDYIVLERMGERAILLRRKTSGLICECRTDQMRQSRQSCRTCYGTGFQGGWNVFYPFLFNFQLAGEQIQLTETAIVMNQNPRAWTTIAPEVRDGDMVVRLHGQLLDRYEITSPARSIRDGVTAIPTIQEFSVKLHQIGHSIYNFPVSIFVPTYVKPTEHEGLTEVGV
jgi:hypothetical protein